VTALVLDVLPSPLHAWVLHNQRPVVAINGVQIPRITVAALDQLAALRNFLPLQLRHAGHYDWHCSVGHLVGSQAVRLSGKEAIGVTIKGRRVAEYFCIADPA
jgi:hypothetical protein